MCSDIHNGPPDLENPVGEEVRKQNFFVALSLLKTPDEAKLFMVDIATEKEITDFAKRWCASQHLFEGLTQEQARARCETSKALVTRAHRYVVKSKTHISRTIYDRMSRRRGKNNRK